MTDITPSPCTALRVRKLARRVSQIYDQALEAYGLTITQFGLLNQLRRRDGIAIGALAEELVMDPTMTRNLRPLEKRGLMVFAPDPADRRSRALHLTEKGRQAFRDAHPGWQAAQTLVEKRLGGTETKALNAALDHLLERLAP
jgi:DNA-binding MarR family transcriptional regulator